MHLLVINCGSSSIKFAVYEGEALVPKIEGLCERIGSTAPTLHLKAGSGSQQDPIDLPAGADHHAALQLITEQIADILGSPLTPIAVGHRVVHGGERFRSATVIDEAVLAGIRSCSRLAPLHNPANLIGIAAAQEAYPDAVQVAVFDTAFHQTLPPKAYLYPLPYELYSEHGIRRYGFHGTSHRFTCEETARRLGKPVEQTSLISVHLGNGCSAAAIEAGTCIDTTMGLTPLEGLVMGTRCGDIDPSIHSFLHRELGLSFAEIDEILNTKSGLLGLSQFSNDMRSLSEAASQGNPKAQLAIDIFVYKLTKAIASLRSTITKCDAISFTGGIGENARQIRRDAATGLSFIGLRLDEELNNRNGDSQGLISSRESSVAAFIIPANEELAIARESLRVLAQSC